MEKFNTVEEEISSGSNISYWTDSSEPLIYQKIDGDKETEVLVIGGGIAGLTTAYCLARNGKKVILVEDGYLGSGETGRTTAHITYALDDRYYEIESILGEEKSRLAAESHKAAIDWISRIVKLEGFDCCFKHADGYLFIDPSDDADNLDREFEATRKAGLPTEIRTGIPGVANSIDERYLLFPQQAQFHVLKYLDGLAKAIVRMGGKIYTESSAQDITSEGARVNEFTVQAQNIVVATNTPVNNKLALHTKQTAYRTYVVAAKIEKGSLPYSMWWDSGNQNSKWPAKPYHYARLEPFDKEYDLLICGGEDHKTGQPEKEDCTEEERYQNLAAWAHEKFPCFSEIIYKWSGQVMEPVDCMGFMGKNPGNDNIYVISGDSGNGMTHCTIGALLITDLIMQRKNEWEELYSPSRITFSETAAYLSEMGGMAYNMAKDWISSGNIEELSDLKPGEGGVISDGFEKIAAYRDADGTLKACSAVCPHLGGILRWNPDEKSFDCPLHGSRFSTDGTVINGPSEKGLKTIEIKNRNNG